MTKAAVRPALSIIGYLMMSALAVMQARGLAPGLPEWFIEAYVAGTFVHVLGWDVVREIEKRRAV